MKKYLFVSIACAIAVTMSNGIFGQVITTTETKPYTLPNGWSLSPAGNSITAGDLPLNIATTKSGRYAAVTNNEQSTAWAKRR